MKLPHIEELTKKILIETKCYYIPVDVFKCAESKKIQLQSTPLEDEISGFFVNKNGKPHIGYNEQHSKVRQRFTVAHEFAHFILHSKQIPLFVDKEEKALYRNTDSASGEIAREREANAFAAALLMPKLLLKREIENIDNEMSESITEYLARRFEVSEKAMAYRLTNLGLLDFGLY